MIGLLLSPVHLDLENDFGVVFSFKNIENIANGGLIMSLEKIGLILYFILL
jgi:hypothetical protein